MTFTAFKEAGRSISAPNHKAVCGLPRKSQTGHPLFVIRLIAAPILADARSNRRAGWHLAGVDYLACTQVDIAGLVVFLYPGLVEFVADSQIEGQIREDLIVVLHIPGHAPLALSNVDAAESRSRRTHAVQQEVCASVSSRIGFGWIAAEGAVVIQYP